MTTPFAFGVRIISDLSFDMLPQVDSDGQTVTLDIRHSRVLSDPGTGLENAYVAQGRTMQIYVGERTLRALVVGMLCFDLSLQSNHVQCTVLSDVPEELIRYWFLQQILPMLLLLNGSTELLHATAIGFGDNLESLAAVGFLGRSGIGKSTLLYYCLQQGCQLLTDEHLALCRSNITYAVPSIPFYRPYRSVEDLGIRALSFASRPLPLSRLYLLQPEAPSAKVSTAMLTDADLISSVLLNSQYSLFSPRVPSSRPILARRFADLATLSRAVPIQRLNVPRSMSRLPEVFQFIHAELSQGL